MVLVIRTKHEKPATIRALPHLSEQRGSSIDGERSNNRWISLMVADSLLDGPAVGVGALFRKKVGEEWHPVSPAIHRIATRTKYTDGQ